VNIVEPAGLGQAFGPRSGNGLANGGGFLGRKEVAGESALGEDGQLGALGGRLFQLSDNLLKIGVRAEGPGVHLHDRELGHEDLRDLGSRASIADRGLPRLAHKRRSGV
jgi:hypothetical protein